MTSDVPSPRSGLRHTDFLTGDMGTPPVVGDMHTTACAGEIPPGPARAGGDIHTTLSIGDIPVGPARGCGVIHAPGFGDIEVPPVSGEMPCRSTGGRF